MITNKYVWLIFKVSIKASDRLIDLTHRLTINHFPMPFAISIWCMHLVIFYQMKLEKNHFGFLHFFKINLSSINDFNQLKLKEDRANSVKSYDAYMYHYNIPTLLQIMACRLFSAKPLSEPMLPYCQLDFREHISMKFHFRFKTFHSGKYTWKCCLPKWQPFGAVGNELTVMTYCS